jgi:hypothetical protein
MSPGVLQCKPNVGDGPIVTFAVTVLGGSSTSNNGRALCPGHPAKEPVFGGQSAPTLPGSPQTSICSAMTRASSTSIPR